MDRGRVVTLRLLGAWTGVVAVTGYLAALMLAVGGAGLDQWRAGIAVVAATAVVAFASARRTSLRFDAAGPLVLAVFGLAIAAFGLGPVAVEFVAAGVLVAALPLAFGGEPVARAGRSALLAGWDGRVLRSVAVTFLDPMMLLPPSAPIGLSLRRPTALRLALAGTLGRSRYAGAAVLVGFAVVVAHIALPTLPGAVLVGLGAYVALTPFGAGLGELWRNPGRRRWLGSPNRELVLAHGVVLAVVGLLWAGVLAAVALAAGTSFGLGAWPAVPLAVLSILRTVTRTAVDYANPGFVDTPIGPMPANLTRQLFRGPTCWCSASWCCRPPFDLRSLRRREQRWAADTHRASGGGRPASSRPAGATSTSSRWSRTSRTTRARPGGGSRTAAGAARASGTTCT